MTGQDAIGATEDARDVAWSLANYDPGAPSSTQMGSASGTEASAAADYMNALRGSGEMLGGEAARLLALVQQDCKRSAEIIDAMHALDEDIASTLNGMDVSSTPVSPAVIGGPQVSPPGNNVGSGGDSGSGSDSW